MARRNDQLHSSFGGQRVQAVPGEAGDWDPATSKYKPENALATA
jgi:hypothetical protein